MTNRAFSWLLVSFGALGISGGIAAVGCGSSDAASIPGPSCTGDCDCSGTTCSCKSGGTCAFGGAASGTTADGGDGGDGGVAPPDNVTFNCQTKNTCDLSCGTGCTSSCAGQSTCEGSCGSNCTSSCTGTSTCTLSTGTNSTVSCGGGSDCNVTLDTGSTIGCTGNSNCNIKCPKGGCTAECQGSSGCTIECGGTVACQIQCNGKQSQACAAGTTCAGTCGGEPATDGGKGK